jgi:predicted permease
MPDWKPLVRDRLAPLRLAPSAEASLLDEIVQHLEDTYRDQISAGASPDDARRAALAELEDAEAIRSAATRKTRMPRRDAVPAGDRRSGNWLEDSWRDVRYALRSLRRTPVFVLFAVATLALGIGANTTVFTLINTLILNPLPVPDAGSLTAVAGTDGRDPAKSSTAAFQLSYRELEDYRTRTTAFATLAGYTSPRTVTLQQEGGSENLFAELVTREYFPTLRLMPAKGRFFLADEDGEAGAHPVAVLNYGTWQSKFGGRADIVGSTVKINNIGFTIVGVAPPRFIGLNAIFGPDLWIPSAMTEILAPTELRNALSDRAKPIFSAVGRLRAGVTREQAQTQLAAVAGALSREFPKTNEGHTVIVRPLSELLLNSNTSGASGVRFASLILSAVVGIVLLIACSNVANLLLARSSSRRQEMAVRLAMGASRPRLVRQLLTESLILAILGGALGLLLGYAGMQFLFGRLPAAANFASPKMDSTVLVFAAAVSLFTGLLFGTLPALRISRAELAMTLKEESRTAGRSRRRISFANALVVGQVAFSLVLLVLAALFLRSIQHAYQIDPGFQTAQLATFMANPAQAGLGKERVRDFYKTARDRVNGLAGVASASWASNLPLWAHALPVEPEGREQRSRIDILRAIVTTVDPSYFPTAGISIQSGRPFTDLDRDTTEPVAIVNEKMAHDHWPGGALGRRVRIPGEEQPRRIVGIARNANYTFLGEPPQPCVYVPLEQHYSDAMVLFVRSRRDPAELLSLVPREVRTIAPDVLLTFPRTGGELVDGALFQAKAAVGLLSVFGALALGLAGIGLYGILAYSVSQRRREIGLRLALGASPSGVMRLVLREGMTIVSVGACLGLALAFGAGRLLSGMFYGVSATDPASVAAAALTLAATALAACYLPARLATRVDPLTSLRDV